MAEIFFKQIFKNKRTYCANVSFWSKKFKKFSELHELNNNWKRKYSGWDGVFPIFEYHANDKIIVINQYDPSDVPENFDEREYLTAYIHTDEDGTERLFIWLIPTEKNVETVIILSELWFYNTESLQETLEAIYSHHRML